MHMFYYHHHYDDNDDDGVDIGEKEEKDRNSPKPMEFDSNKPTFLFSATAIVAPCEYKDHFCASPQ